MKNINLERKIDQYLINWKNDKDHMPLIVQGARQIGKTHSIEELGKTYKSFVEINFFLNPEFKAIVSPTKSNTYDSIIKEISNIDPSKKFIENETLIFFDEIQEFPEICTSLKSFNQSKKYDVICSGSLLGINYKSISSIPVGNKEDIKMNGLDFEEFLWAKGYPKTLKNELLESMINKKELSPALYNTLRSLFYDFTVLGGMPEVIEKYLENNNFEKAAKKQKQILKDYRQDIKKYAFELNKSKIEAVYDHIPVQLGKNNPKFQISKVKTHAKSRDYDGVKEWLLDSGIILISYGLNFPELPLKGNYDSSNYRLYYSDTGLLIASLDEESQNDLRANKNLGVYKGAVYENMIADSLTKQDLPLYFYKRPDGTLEEDFFARTKNHLVPLEVKAKGGKSKSLKSLIELDKYSDISFGIKLCDSNIDFKDNVYIFPHFLSFLLKDFLKNID